MSNPFLNFFFKFPKRFNLPINLIFLAEQKLLSEMDKANYLRINIWQDNILLHLRFREATPMCDVLDPANQKLIIQ